MTNKPTSLVAAPSFREKKKSYVDTLHAELGLNRRFRVGLFVSEFLVSTSALQAAYPKFRGRTHMREYFERRLATLEATFGADHWKVSCYLALRRDYLAGALDWAISEYMKDSAR